MGLALRINHLSNPFKKLAHTHEKTEKQNKTKVLKEEANFIKHFKGICVCG